MRIVFVIIFAYCFSGFSQVFPGTPVSGFPSGTTTEITNTTNPVEATIAYSTNEKIFYYYNGNTWIPFFTSSQNFGDIKYGIQTNDHNGWYLLNGRNISTLSSNARTTAISLGFTSTLPNATNRVLKHPNSGENVGELGGQEQITLSRANLPNLDFTGSTTTNGNHSHTISRQTRTERIVNRFDDNRTYFGDSGTTNTSTSGDHSHTVTVSSGGSNQPFETYQPYLVVNTFIYLGD
ncbi:hypothetical protein [Tenacibaculum sp. SZ-18]|uniref:hypothetical protein n=1 Tax=Tenacibaculum sp. SZ-18 TaxID=754423 RepID=UPI0012FD1450|nr:hypothetical protein [Tenacibaculum sp. SZ-18]